jgi:hypothetical protein
MGRASTASLFATAPLDLQFAATKTLDSRVTFTRASTGTYTGSDGLVKTATSNQSRFDHNPTTAESLGLLVEEARTNAVISSADFSTGWTPIRTTLTTNQTTAPDGTTTADLLTEDTSTNTHVIQNTFAVTSGTSYTLSVWAKQNASVSPTRNIRILFPSAQFTTQVAAGFDLTTGVITPTNSPVATSLQFYANGWTRVSCTATCATTSASCSITIQMSSGTTVTYTGGSSGLYLWGAQFETGAFMTSYIPTTGTTATRAADVASITGSNFSSFYNQTEGTVFAEAAISNTGANRFIADITDSGITEEIGIFWSTVFNSLVIDSNTTQATLFGGTIIPNSRTLHSFGYKLNDFQGYGNAVTLSFDTAGTLPTVDRLTIGSRVNSTFWANGTIKRLVYWPTRLSNTILQQITQL